MNKSLFHAIVVDILLGIGLLLYMLKPTSAVSPALYMTSADAALTRGAITLVVNEISSGKITSYDIAIQALKAELPHSVQDDVVARLQDSTFATISDDMVALAGNIQIRDN